MLIHSFDLVISTLFSAEIRRHTTVHLWRVSLPSCNVSSARGVNRCAQVFSVSQVDYARLYTAYPDLLYWSTGTLLADTTFSFGTLPLPGLWLTRGIIPDFIEDRKRAKLIRDTAQSQMTRSIENALLNTISITLRQTLQKKNFTLYYVYLIIHDNAKCFYL